MTTKNTVQKNSGSDSENPYNLANFLTISRMLLAPVFIVSMIAGCIACALVLFVLAAATDTLDGFIARRYKMQTEFGKFIDPLADKVLMTIAYIVLSIPNSHLIFTIPLWLTLLVIGRDMIITSGCMVIKFFNRHLVIAPLRIGKLCTFSQILTIFLSILFNLMKTSSIIFTISLIITAVLTILSGYEYVKSGMIQLVELNNG